MTDILVRAACFVTVIVIGAALRRTGMKKMKSRLTEISGKEQDD